MAMPDVLRKIDDAARANKRAQKANREAAVATRQAQGELEAFCREHGIRYVREAVERPPLPRTPADTGRSRG